MAERRGLSTYTERAVGDFVVRASTRAERVVSSLRCLLLAAILVRSLSLRSTWDSTVEVAWPAIWVIGGGFLISLYILVYLRRHPASPALIWLSVTLDAALLFMAQLATPLWPGPDYPGVLLMADLALFSIVTLVAGVRLLPSAAAWAALLNSAGFVVVIWVDQALHAPGFAPAYARLAMFSIIQASGVALAMIVAVRTQSLVRDGALHAVQAELAERRLGSLMQDHHDVRTLLSSAALNADLVARQVRGERSGEPGELREMATELTESLARVNEFVAGIRERAFDELVALQDPAAVDVRQAMEAVATEVRPRFPDATIEIAPGCDEAAAWIAGGEPVLKRVLLNLMVNACEGDGREGAGRVDLDARLDPTGDGLIVRVVDDGPGFPRAALEAPPGTRATTKPGGSGLGLLMVRALLGAASGSFHRENRPEGGALVSFELPLAESRAVD